MEALLHGVTKSYVDLKKNNEDERTSQALICEWERTMTF